MTQLHLLTAPPPLAGALVRTLRLAGIDVRVTEANPVAVTDAVASVEAGGWLAVEPPPPDVLDAARAEAVRRGAELVVHDVAVPGARLLDVVATMDRLRSPGGCPWDAEQTHASLAPYLLEETYEAYEALEEDDLAALREELGDVLLQVVFHARLAEERTGADRWTIDDVADGLVRKLVRRHPHVFAETVVQGPAEVSANWDAIKAAEKDRTSVTEGVPMGQPALTLAATLQRKAAGAQLPVDLVAEELPAQTLVQSVCATATTFDEEPTPGHLGALLFAVVALARQHDLDPEAALRARARRFRDRLVAVERDGRGGGATSNT